MADIFLSYDSEDRDRVRPLVAAFEQQGWTVWWDRRIPPGKRWDQFIQAALDASRCVVVVWSQHSINSEWVLIEAEVGKERGVLIPLLIDDVKVPLSFRLKQAARLTDWQATAPHPEWDFLLATIKTILGAPAPEQPATPPLRRTDEIPAPPTPSRSPQESSLPESHSDAPVAGEAGLIFTTFEFEVVTLDAQGKLKEWGKGQARYFTEDLGGGVTLEMVDIPGGSFTMGSPVDEAERDDDEGPQHQVIIKPFQMGKFEVTQAQWRLVAGLPQVNCALHPEPSHFKGDDLPVEQVSWDEAVEFCARLARQTGKNYRLPSEAEWEYAARAGTITPFAFGGAITSALVNYDGNYPYAAAQKSVCRQKTVPVGSLGVANAFGLFDMHGNVGEWCQDIWQPDYDGAPDDGSAWLRDEIGTHRVLRGGSWNESGRYCRAANRFNTAPDVHYNTFGLRVVMASRAGNP